MVFRVGLGGGDRYIGNGRICTANMCSRIYTIVPSYAPFALRLVISCSARVDTYLCGAACVARLNLVLHLSYVRLRNDRPVLVCAGSRVFYLTLRLSSSQGNEHIRVSKFYKEGREGKFVTFLFEDTLTLYDGFRRGAKESSESLFSEATHNSFSLIPVFGNENSRSLNFNETC